MENYKPVTLYAVKQKKSGRLISGTNYRFHPHRQILSDDFSPPLLFTGKQLLGELKHRTVSNRYYDVVVVEVREVKCGKWKDNANFYVCSICNEWVDVLQCSADMNYCPNCGARMDGEQSGNL